MAVSKRSPRSERWASARPGSHDAKVNGVHAQVALDGMVREELVDIQRARIVRATYDVAAERGANGVTVSDVVERAGVSRRTFYDLFGDRDECFLAAFEQARSHVSGRVVPAYESQDVWREQLRAALISLLGFLDEEPVIGRLLIVESAATGSATQQLRRETIEKITLVIEEGAREASAVRFPPAPLTAEGVVGGVLAVIQSRLSEQAPGPFLELINPLMSMVVLPYLGATAARAELKRALPEPTVREADARLLANPFRDTGLRLTYRTVRVLVAISELMGGSVNASNRLIAEMAEINDQGQVSKLLMRLQRAGLVSNSLMPAKGAPNNWVLTDRGRQVVFTVKAHSEDTTAGGLEG